MKKQSLSNLITQCSTLGKDALNNLPSHESMNDVRYRYFEYYSGTLAVHLVIQQLQDKGISEANLKALGFKVNERVVDSVNYQLEFTNRVTLLINSVSSFETAIRRVASSIGVEQYEILKTVEELVRATSLSTSYVELFKIILYSRNAVLHFGGIHTKDTIPLEYKGRKFLFTKGKGLHISEDDLEFVLSEMMEFFKRLSLTERIKAIEFIKDPFVEAVEK